MHVDDKMNFRDQKQLITSVYNCVINYFITMKYVFLHNMNWHIIWNKNRKNGFIC